MDSFPYILNTKGNVDDIYYTYVHTMEVQEGTSPPLEKLGAQEESADIILALQFDFEA